LLLALPLVAATGLIVACPWAQLQGRIFDLDVLRCARCRGQRRVPTRVRQNVGCRTYALSGLQTPGSKAWATTGSALWATRRAASIS